MVQALLCGFQEEDIRFAVDLHAEELEPYLCKFESDYLCPMLDVSRRGVPLVINISGAL